MVIGELFYTPKSLPHSSYLIIVNLICELWQLFRGVKYVTNAHDIAETSLISILFKATLNIFFTFYIYTVFQLKG